MEALPTLCFPVVRLTRAAGQQTKFLYEPTRAVDSTVSGPEGGSCWGKPSSMPVKGGVVGVCEGGGGGLEGEPAFAGEAGDV